VARKAFPAPRMAPSAAPAAALPRSQWPTPPSCPGSPLCDPATAADAATTSTATSLVPGRAPATCDYVFHTTAGDVTFRAYRALSPKGADRLHTLVRHGYYDGSALYRVLPGFVAQFGVAADPSLARVYDYRENHPGAILEDEPAIINPDGPGNDKLWLSYSSAYDDTKSPPRAVNRTAELFVNLVDNREKLDEKGFASFARVVRGSEVIDKWFAGYGEMRDACDLHPDGGWVCEGPSETDLYARGVEAYVDEHFPKLDRIGYVTATPDPTDPDPGWYYGNSKHHFSWSEGGEGHGVLFYVIFSLTLLMFFLLIRRQKTVSSKERRLS